MYISTFMHHLLYGVMVLRVHKCYKWIISASWYFVGVGGNIICCLTVFEYLVSKYRQGCRALEKKYILSALMVIQQTIVKCDHQMCY